jgi:hypothetical protein
MIATSLCSRQKSYTVVKVTKESKLYELTRILRNINGFFDLQQRAQLDVLTSKKLNRVAWPSHIAMQIFWNTDDRQSHPVIFLPPSIALSSCPKKWHLVVTQSKELDYHITRMYLQTMKKALNLQTMQNPTTMTKIPILCQSTQRNRTL